MTDMNKIVDKIQKLLSLAGNNPSEEEAKAAMLKAHKLIAEYNIDMSNLNGETIEYAVVPGVHPNNNGYRISLGVALARSFRCKVIMVGSIVNFFGRKEDAEACAQVFNYAYKVSRTIGARLEREARRNGENTHGVANSYWMGFVKGISEKLDEQCQALAVIVPPDVKEEYSKRYTNTRTYRGGMKNTGYNFDAYSKGVSDGRNVMNKQKQIEG